MFEAVLFTLKRILRDKSELFKAHEIEPEVEIENCDIHDTHGEGWSQVRISNSKLKISNSNIYSSKMRTGIYIDGSPKAILHNCKVYQNGGNGVQIKNSPDVKIEYCDVYDNGSSSKDYPQIVIEASKVLIENSKVWTEANSSKTSTGIYIIASPKAILKNCKVFQNNINGVDIKNSPDVKIEYCDIYNNGSSSDNYPQIWIGDSKVLIENSKVWMETKNINNGGIYIISGAAPLCKVST